MVQRTGYYWVNSVDALRGNPPAFVDYLDQVTALGVSATVMAGCEMIADGALLAETRDFMGRARLAGHQVSLDLGWHRLVNDPGRQDRMIAGLSKIVSQGYREPHVYSFSLDEPPPAGSDQFRDFTRRLKETFPRVRVQTMYEVPALAAVPPDMNDFVDDLGFDWYFWVPDFEGFERHFARIEEIGSRGQRLWLYPETFVYTADMGDAARIKTYIRDILPFYHDFARRHPRVYGAFYFIWNAPAAGVIGLGLQQFTDPESADYDPAIRDLVVGFGREVAGI